MKSLSYVLVAVAVLGMAAHGGASKADPVAEFYQGKRMAMMIGSGPGTNYDGYGRLLARHIVKHIPGTPAMVPQNRPGAGSINAINFVYNVAPQDGTVMLMLNRAAPFAQILGQKGPQFEAAKLNWIGSLAKDAGVVFVAKDVPVRTLADMRTSTVITGGTSPGTENVIFPSLLNNTLGTKFKMIQGYESLNAQFLAFERGEVKAMESSFSSLKRKYKDWRNEVTVLVQLGLTGTPELAGVPLVFDLIKPEYVAKGMTVEEAETYWRVIVTPNDMGRPFAVGPNVPADRVKALRAAFQFTLADPEFVAEAKKARRDIDPIGGEEIQAMIERAAATPRAVIEKLNEEIKYRAVE